MLKTKIEWCDSSWNPVSGCYRGCEYCYARGISNRFKGCDASPEARPAGDVVYLTERQMRTCADGVKRNAAYPYGFTPTFHEYRLSQLKTKELGETIFVCSMGDMFGPWIPNEWIIKVLEACQEAPEHRYLFLTKYPARYVDLDRRGLLPSNDSFWYGTTAPTGREDIFKSEQHNTFVSIEPILAPLEWPTNPWMASKDNWVILGAETGNRADKVIPERNWIEKYVDFCREFKIPVFMKDSLKPIWGENIITEFPWDK